MKASPHCAVARLNPFRAERLEALRYRLSKAEWQALLARLAASRFRGAITGPKGSGKTTLLLELSDELLRLGHATSLFLADGETRLPRAQFKALVAQAQCTEALLLLDGANRFTWWQWQRFLHATRQAPGLVVTQHRAGRLPTLYHCTTPPGVFTSLVEELTGDEAVANPLTASELEALLTACRGNVREALRALYDRWPVSTAGSR